jgi:deazaflavin-dependent oxidoreductase (nitroreductase family)
MRTGAPALATERFCYLETIGRVSGRPHEVEMWFSAGADGWIYMLAGKCERRDWVKNLRRNPSVRVQVGGVYYSGVAHIIEDIEGDQRARRLLAAKYQGWRDGAPLSEWARKSLPVAILLDLNDA